HRRRATVRATRRRPRRRRRPSLVGAVAGERVSFGAWELVRPVTLTGYSSEDLDGPALRRGAADVFALLQAGKLTPPRWQTMPLEDAANAHRLLEQGAVSARILLTAEQPNG